MSENQPEDLPARAGRAADDLTEGRSGEPEARQGDQKAQEIADDVRAETGQVYEGEDPADDGS
jgi:hypothetical protein